MHLCVFPKHISHHFVLSKYNSQLYFSAVFLSCILQCISYVYFPTVFLCSGVATLLNPHQSSLQLHKCSLSSPPVSITFATITYVFFSFWSGMKCCMYVGEMINRVQLQSIRAIIQGRFYGWLPQLLLRATYFAFLNGRHVIIIIMS